MDEKMKDIFTDKLRVLDAQTKGFLIWLLFWRPIPVVAFSAVELCHMGLLCILLGVSPLIQDA